MLVSNGTVVKGPDVVWSGTTQTWGSWPRSFRLGDKWVAYGALYRGQLWVFVVVDKRAMDVARLPLKVYERMPEGRREARDHAYGQLLRRPNDRHSPFFFWLWTSSTYDVFGEIFWAKQRDKAGRPVALVPLHPTCMRIEEETSTGLVWSFDNGKLHIDDIAAADLVHMHSYNPDDMHRGMSTLEPLRRTLEFEDAAQRAQSSFWRQGARPGAILTHPGTISKPAQDWLKLQWDELAGGADNTGRSLVLEEGMKPEFVTVNAEEAQYIESRKLNREEVIAAFDVPPPAVHVLDQATFSNITEQMRSKYRDTNAPRLNSFEAELELQLRGAVRPGASAPDFGDDVYAEFLLDEVMRGDFEARTAAKAQAIQTGQMTPKEARDMENQPFIEGSDQLFINAAMLPIQNANRPSTSLPPATARTVLGRLGRHKSLAEVDPYALAAGLNGEGALVLAVFEDSLAAGDDVSRFRDRLRALTERG